jgi:hypothetical protein
MKTLFAGLGIAMAIIAAIELATNIAADRGWNPFQ